ncbi:MAG: VOC family protein [Gammaproteobacteria bacterium]|nr:VOC family protein [Gammaproteobacteria bacterium]
MDLHGSINHIALTVSDLDEAMRFYTPLLEELGYTINGPMPYKETRLTVNVHERNGTAVNIWQASRQHPFDIYEPGLHHLAFNASSKAAVDAVHQLVVALGATVLDGPAEFPFSHKGYYAVYFLGPDGVKIEVVHMPGLADAIARGNASAA